MAQTTSNKNLTVKVEVRGSNLEILKSKEKEILASAAAGTGKTVACLLKIHLTCLSVPGVRCLVVRKAHNSLTASTLVTFRKQVAAEAIASGLVSYYGGSGSEPAAFRYTNGSTIVVGGLDKPTRLMSTEYDLAFVDEAIETTPEDLDTIITRLRHGRLSYQQLLMATNPGPPTHHLKQRCDAGRCRMIYGRHEDNPRMYDRGEWTDYGRNYLEILDSLVGVRYQRLRLGRWVAAEGLVYDTFDANIHTIQGFPIPEDWNRYLTIDFGFTNPFVAQFWAEDPDGRLYLYKEIYQTQVLVEDHAKVITRILGNGPRPRMIICDHDAEDRATLERHLECSTIAAKKSVSDGIQAVQSRLKVQGDRKPRLYIFKDALYRQDKHLLDIGRPSSTLEEIQEYVWSTKKDAPVKANDHGCDALRYLCAELDLRGRPRFTWIDGGRRSLNDAERRRQMFMSDDDDNV